MSWIPRLSGDGKGVRMDHFHILQPRARKGGRVLPYLAVSAPFVIKVLISSSWPYLAATWRGVLPYLSAQSISLPRKEETSALPASPCVPVLSSPGCCDSHIPVSGTWLISPFSIMQRKNCKLLCELRVHLYPANPGH